MLREPSTAIVFSSNYEQCTYRWITQDLARKWTWLRISSYDRVFGYQLFLTDSIQIRLLCVSNFLFFPSFLRVEDIAYTPVPWRSIDENHEGKGGSRVWSDRPTERTQLPPMGILSDAGQCCRSFPVSFHRLSTIKESQDFHIRLVDLV